MKILDTTHIFDIFLEKGKMAADLRGLARYSVHSTATVL